jgi:PAS domain S-box-containing protein
MGRGEVDFSVFDQVNPLVVALDPAGPIARWNPACSKLTGYSLEEARGKKLWEFLIPADEIDAVRTVFESLRAREYPSSFVNHWVTRSGDKRKIRWANTCIVDDEGEVLSILGTGIEVVERPSFVAQTAVDPRPGRTLRSSFPMWVFDRGTLEVRAVNDAALARYGYSRDEFLALSLRELRAPEETPAVHEPLMDLGDGVQWITPVRHRTKHGEVVAVELAVTPVEFAGQAAAMVLVHEPR